MFQDKLQKLKPADLENSVTVADIERIRRQRRTAQTEAEQAQLREYMRSVSSELRKTTRLNSDFLRAIGIAMICAGIILGGTILYLANHLGPAYHNFLH